MTGMSRRDGDPKGAVRVVILEDGYFASTGMQVVLEREDDIEVVGDTADHTNILALVEQSAPDVAIVDLKLSGSIENGIEAISGIHRAFPEVQCVVVTSFPELPHFLACVKAGARAFICKDADPKLSPSLPDLVRKVSKGGRYYDPELVEHMVNYIDGGHLHREQLSGESETQLTQRELEVLDLLIEERSNQEIADALVISSNTVKVHVSNICSKLGVENRHQAALVGIRRGLSSRGGDDRNQ